MDITNSSIWRRVELKKPEKQQIKKPRITVNPKTGRIAFNAAACGLVPHLFFFKKAIPLEATAEDGSPVWGFQFVGNEEASETDLTISKRERENRTISSCVIVSKPMARLITHNGNKTETFMVRADNDFLLRVIPNGEAN